MRKFWSIVCLVCKHKLTIQFIAPMAFIALLGSCIFGESDSASRDSSTVECIDVADCGGSDVCFFSRCVDAGFARNSIGAEATPPSGSGLLTQTIPFTIALNAGFQELALQRTITIEGTIQSDGEMVAGTVEASTPLERRCTPPLPNRNQRYRSTPTETGYVLQVPAGSYLLRFIPDDENLPPIVLDAGIGCGVQLENDDEISAVYPGERDRMTLEGRLQAAENGSLGVLGARVSGIGTTASGIRVSSSTASSASDGSFSLVFPAPVVQVDLCVGPGERRLVPDVVFERLVVEDGRLATQSLSLRPLLNITLQLTGLNEDGESIEVTDAVAVFQGEVGGGILNFETSTGMAQLPPGDYVLTVIPPTTSSLALISTRLIVTTNIPEGAGVSDAAVNIPLQLPNRVTVSGSVVALNDDVVAGAELIFISTDAPLSRSFQTTTDADGSFDVLLDPPEFGETIDYDVIIEPPRESGLPRSRQFVELARRNDALMLRIPGSSFVFGRVVDENDRPVSDTLLRFFSLELPTRDSIPLEIGAAQTGPDGSFSVPLALLP